MVEQTGHDYSNYKFIICHAMKGMAIPEYLIYTCFIHTTQGLHYTYNP